MPEVKRILLSKILVTPRQRAVDDCYARVIGASMVEHGQLQPILVRSTPAAERPYTLVIGGHRVTGAAMFSLEALDAVIVKANALEAQALELAENLHRRDLSVLDRAQFLAVYRALCEEKYGPVRPGGAHDHRLALWSTEGASGFSQAAADQLGLSKRSAHYLGAIARNLHPMLKSALQHHAAAYNQTQLLALSRLEPDKQRKLALALQEQPDLRRAKLSMTPCPRRDRSRPSQADILSRLITAWADATGETRLGFLEHIGAVFPPSESEAA